MTSGHGHRDQATFRDQSILADDRDQPILWPAFLNVSKVYSEYV